MSSASITACVPSTYQHSRGHAGMISESPATIQRAACQELETRPRHAPARRTRENPQSAVGLKKLVHDLRESLAVIMLATDGALRSARSPGSTETLKLIREEAVRAEQIMQSTIERACGAVSKPPANLNSVAQRAVAAAQRYCDAWTDHRPAWDVDLARPAPWVEMDGVAIEQVIVNLMKNAVESSAGAVRITLRTVCKPELAEVIVSDNGGGIPRESLPRIFEPHYSTKHGAAARGLGLSICSELVTAHGGKLRVQSEVGRGSVFTVELPRANRRPTEAARRGEIAS